MKKRIKKYENITKPKIIDATYCIDIFPERQDAYLKADLTIKNKSSEIIDSLHFTIEKDLKHKISIPNASLAFEDKELDYQIYALQQPILPNDSISITIKATQETSHFMIFVWMTQNRSKQGIINILFR